MLVQPFACLICQNIGLIALGLNVGESQSLFWDLKKESYDEIHVSVRQDLKGLTPFNLYCPRDSIIFIRINALHTVIEDKGFEICQIRKP